MSPLVAVPIEIGERRRPLQNLSLLAQKQLQDGDLLLHRRPGLLLSLQLGKPIEQARINRLGECRRLACLRFRGHRITQSMTTIVGRADDCDAGADNGVPQNRSRAFGLMRASFWFHTHLRKQFALSAWLFRPQ